MTETSTRHAARNIALLVVTGFLIGCDSAREPSGIPSLPSATASKTSGVTVTAANPSFGRQGQVSEAVTITGTGFAPGAQAAWVRNGVVDTTITVTSTQYVSSTTLVATINISPKSPVEFRDVQVMSSGRTPGIGSLLFEVTQAIPISGTSWVRSINDNGEATGTLSGGTGVFYYDVNSARLETVSPAGTGYDISPTGTWIVGSGGAGSGFPYVYTRTGAGTWQATALPVGAATTSGVARSMRSDGTGQAVQIGGIEYYATGRNGSGTRAVTWSWQAATASWQRLQLPGVSAEVRHRALADNGVLGGTADGGQKLGPAVWMPNGTAGYTLTTLAPAGAVNGVRADGGMLVGFTSVPVYWLAQSGGTWSAPIVVAGGCSGVKDVSDAGRFLLNDCPIANGGVASAAYADAPYGSLTRLGGLGPKGNVGFASGISHSGHYAAGYANVNNQGSVGIYWTLP